MELVQIKNAARSIFQTASQNANEDEFLDGYLDGMDRQQKFNARQSVGFSRVAQAAWDAAIEGACSCECPTVTVRLVCAGKNEEEVGGNQRKLNRRLEHARNLKQEHKGALEGPNGFLNEGLRCGMSKEVDCTEKKRK